MNHIFRLVWNFKTRCYAVASEIARVRGKSGGVRVAKPGFWALLSGGILVPFSSVVFAEIIAAGGNTEVYTAGNGVPVIDIATANANGLSHNQFTKYNVGANGLVLNNNTDLNGYQSQLAGQVLKNVNLNNPASIILNEVVAANRSTLAGFTEVAGQKADVIVANPWGITCSGCGFINSDHSTLTTGKPNITGGNLMGFNVTQGDVLINGSGANLSAQQMFDVVARSIHIDGQINANDLILAAGSNNWNYVSRTATPIAGVGSVPSYAIDSTLLGGMYANKIQLIATEAGVGVRMLGDAAATQNDFSITAEGKVEIRSKVSAATNLMLASADTGGDAISLIDSQLTATQNLLLTANAGGATLSGGVLKAGNNLSYTLASLTDTSSAAVITDNNKRYGANNTQLNVSGTANVDDVSYGANNALSITANTLTLGAGTSDLYTDLGALTLVTTGNLALNDASVKSANGVTLTSSAGQISTTAGADQGVQATTGNIVITAANGLNNAGKVSADAGSLTVRASNAITNSGSLHGNTAVTLSDASSAGSENINNSGKILSDATLTINANALTNTNTGSIQGTGTSNISATTLSNSGVLIASNTGGLTGTLTTTGALSNSGTLQSAGTLVINTGTTLTNSAGAKIIGSNNVTLRGTTASTYTVNDDGQLQAGGLLDIKGNGGTNAVNVNVGAAGVLLGNTVDTNANAFSVANGGKVGSAAAMTLNLASLTFGGTNSRIVGATGGSGTVGVTVASAFSNPGAIHSGGNLTFNAPTITNTSTGGLSALGTLTVNATAGDLSNAGSLYAGTQLNASSTATFTNVANTGTLDSGGSMSLSAVTFINNNMVDAAQNITVSANTFRNEVPGGDTRAWGADSAKTTVETSHAGQGYHGCGCVDQTEWWWYKDTWSRDQYYVGGAAPAYKPQMIAGNIFTIQNFTTGTNIGGVLSANTLNLIGNVGATFTNNDLALLHENYYETYRHFIEYIAAGPAKYTDDWRDYSGAVLESTTVNSSIGAGIFANTINASGFTLVNAGAPVGATPTAPTTPTAATPTTGAAPVTIPGLVLTLPTNPNGYFVPSQNPSSAYLIETNPLYAVGSNFNGSNYLAQRYGYDPEVLMKRLGDANYEAYLIRQQLIAQTGNNLLAGYVGEEEQVTALLEHGADEAKRLGMVWGQPPTAEQLANLKEDMVWMIEVTVQGQKVLAPQVFLSPATKNSIETGAVIAGTNVNMNLDAVTNTGGTIRGSETLNITSKGDITNTSGTIKGGSVSLTSTEGSIVNETWTHGSGNDEEYRTVIGKTGAIESTGNLSLDANQNIKVIGAEVKAGGDAALAAGGDVTFDTIVDKNTSTTHASSSTGLVESDTSTTVSTEKNIGSNLQTSGNLSIKSGKDTTIAGSHVNVGGNLDVQADGDFNVIARQDKVTTHTETSTSGLGVGGGVGGMENTTTDNFKGSNNGSTLYVGGNANIVAGSEMVLQGSDMTVGGNADINATDGIKILDGLDEERTTTVTQTTTFLKTGGDESSSSGSESGTDTKWLKGEASASAEANAQSNHDLKLAETSVSTTHSGSNTSVASNLKVGGNLNASTQGTLTIQGSNVEAGGDVALDAKNVEVLTGRNEQWSNTETTRTSVGFYEESGANAGAEASAEGKAYGPLATNGNAHAGASASADSTITTGVRHEEESSSDYKLTNSASSIKSGGNLSIKADEKATFVGANVESGGDMSIEATDIENRAAQDIELSTSSKATHTAGIYINANAGAEANADVNAQTGLVTNADASAGASAEAEASAGLRYKNESESSTEGSITNVTNTFKAGGNFSRTATDTIVDQGTQVEAGGDINQSARVIRDEAIHDETFSSSESSSHDARIGVYAGASAEASASASGGAAAGAEASAGLKAQYDMSMSSESSNDKTAVTSKFKAGGNINSKSEEKTTLVGTQFESGGDVNIEAGSLDYKAAQDSSSSTSSSHELGVEGKVAIYGSAGVSLDAEYGYEGGKNSSTTAKAGSINAGGNLNIKTSGDATFVGTNLEAGKGASIDAGGNVDFQAAKNTSSSRDNSASAELSLSATKSDKGASIGGGYQQTDSSSETSTVGSIKSGSGGTSIKSGGNTTLEGTQLESSGATIIEAGGDVNLKAAVNKETELSFSVSAEAGAEKGGEGSKQSGAVGGGVTYYEKVDSTTTNIQSAGGITIKGKTITSQESQLKSEQGSVGLEGKVVNKDAQNHEFGVGVEVNNVGAEHERQADNKPAGSAAQ